MFKSLYNFDANNKINFYLSIKLESGKLIEIKKPSNFG